MKHFYNFDRFRIDLAERVLLSEGEIVPLTQKAFEVLLVLVERRGQIVEKEELMQQVWPDTFVEEGNLSQNIYTLRKVLGQTSDGQEFIKTIPKRGYRFAANVHELKESDHQPLSLASTPPNLTGERAVFLAAGKKSEEIDDSLPRAALDDSENTIPKPKMQTGQLVQFPKTPAAMTPAKPAYASNDLLGRIMRHKLLTSLALVGLVVAAIGSLWWLYSSSGQGFFGLRERQMKIVDLTTTGNVACAAVSPDGKYVAYGLADGPQRSSLWLMQTGSLATQQISPPSEIQFHAVTFSRDGQQVYYVAKENAAPRTLYRVATLGGPPKKLLDNVQTAISFSPDGSQFTFRRFQNERREAVLFIANADGSGERELASSKFPEALGDPAWSPDGKMIACASGIIEGNANMHVVAVRVADGAMKPVTAQKWRWVGQLGWMADSRALLMVASDHTTSPYQVWRVDYETGEARKITNDSIFYNRLSLSADSKTVVATQRRQVTNVWMLPREDGGKAQQITFGAGSYRGHVSWTPEGKIVYESQAGSAPALSVMNADGSHQKQLMGELSGRAYVGQPMASPDGRYLIFASDLAGIRHIWRMNSDGSNPIQLTNGDGEDNPHCSPDGRWVVYTRMERAGFDRPTIWRISIDGGQPTQLTNEFTAYPAVSPDGKRIACLYGEKNSAWKLAVYSMDGGPPTNIFTPSRQISTLVRWTPDGRGLTYAENPIGPAKLWIQPIEGGEPKQLAEFASDRIFGFDWSLDGKQLVCVRGLWATNVALIKDFD